MTANEAPAKCVLCGKPVNQNTYYPFEDHENSCPLRGVAMELMSVELWNRLMELLAAREKELERVAFEAACALCSQINCGVEWYSPSFADWQREREGK